MGTEGPKGWQLSWLLKQNIKCGRNLGRPWRRTFGLKEVLAKREWDTRLSPVFSRDGELLTLREIVELLIQTNMPPIEDA